MTDLKVSKSKDGQDVPKEGLKFTFLVGPEGEQVEKSIVLHDVLAGLNVLVNPDKTQSQATSFASFAVQKGYEDEAAIANDYRNETRLFLDDEQNVTCRSWSLISKWQSEIRDARSQRAIVTMEANGTRMSTAQMENAFRLAGLCEDKGFTVLANSLRTVPQLDEMDEGPLGARLSSLIGKANTLLNMKQPKTAENPSGQEQADFVGESVGDDDTKEF